jgi:hypothetical protein
MSSQPLVKDTNEHQQPEMETDSIFTNWNNEPTVRDLKQDLEDAKPTHDNQVSKIRVWLDNLNITGTAKRPKVKGRSSITPKLIRKQAEWRYASLSEPFLDTEDIFNTDPVTHEDKDGAIQNGLVLNNQFNTKIDKVNFIDEYVRTAVDEGTVICRVGWDFEEEKRTVEEPVIGWVPSQNPEVLQMFQQIHDMALTSPQNIMQLSPEERAFYEASLVNGVPVEEGEVGTREVEKLVTVKNHPTVEVCDYRNIISDPSCKGDLEKARFIIYSFETSLSELKKEGKYKNLDKINIENSSVLNEADHATAEEIGDFNFSDKPRKRFVAFEYWGFWDINGDGMVQPIVATWVGNTLIRLEENPFPDKQLPFISAQYLPVRKSIYGEPDGELLEDNQEIIGAVTRGMIDIMGRSANGQVGTKKGALDITNRRKFDKGMDYEFNSNEDPRQAIFMHTYPEIPRSAEFMLGMQNAEAESLTGVKAFSNGITGNALGDTVGGQINALDATAKRELGILRRLAKGIKKIGRKFMSMNGEFLEEEEIIRITNGEFVKIRRDDLAGYFDLKLTISTAEADDAKAKELSFMLQTMGNNMDAEMSQMILADIARLRKMPELEKKIKDYTPQPDPVAQEKAILEVELLKAQIANEGAKAQENTVDVDLKTAKTKVEQAKARNLESKSDLQDLDFLETETGTKHSRDLEKLEHDRGTKLDLKAADKMLADDEKKGPRPKL